MVLIRLIYWFRLFFSGLTKDQFHSALSKDLAFGLIVVYVFCRTFCSSLTFSSLQTNTDTFANSADPDEMACNEPSNLDLHCLQLLLISD